MSIRNTFQFIFIKFEHLFYLKNKPGMAVEQQDHPALVRIWLSAWKTHVNSSRMLSVGLETYPKGQMISRKVNGIQDL